MPDEPTSGSAGTGGPTDRPESPAPGSQGSASPTPPSDPPGSHGASPGQAPSGPYGAGGHGPSPYGHVPYDQGGFSPGQQSSAGGEGDPGGQPGQPGRSGPYGQGPPPQGPYGAGPRGQGGYGPGPGPGAHGQPPYGQPPYGPDPYGQPPYGPDPYGQPPYGPDPYGQNPYGQDPYGQNPYGPAGSPYGQNPYGQPPSGQPPYGQNPYGYGTPGPSQGHHQGHTFNWPYVPPRPQRSPEERRKRTRRAITLLAVIVVAVGAGIGIGAAIAPQNPSTVADGLVTQSVAAATNAGTYHYVELSTVVGYADDISGDAGPNGGRQVITQTCSAGKNVYDLRLVSGVVYFRGNAPAVVDQLGVSKGKATSTAGQWVKVKKGESPYSAFSAGITASSNVSQLKTTLIANTSSTDSNASPPTTKVLGFLNNGKGKGVGTAALTIASGTSLPRSLNGDATATGTRYSLSWTFSHYHEKLNVAAPSNAVAYSSLNAKKPSKTVCA